MNALRQGFLDFAAAHATDDALNAALAAAVAERPTLLALMEAAPPTQRLPVLLLAAVHERVRAGVLHPLADYYPARGGRRAPDAALPDALADFLAAERPALEALLASRATQTNEIGRSAVLWPALQRVLERTGRRELALYDFGCSAGLNLGVDAYRYRCGSTDYGRPGAEPVLDIDWRAGLPAQALQADWRLVARAGVDVAPPDPADEAAARWLQACVWPLDRARQQRLEQALHLARLRRDRLIASADGLAALRDAHGRSPAQPLLLNSWVLSYFDAEALQAYQARARRRVADEGWAWISAEPLSRHPAPPAGLWPALPAGESRLSATLWTLHWRDAAGRLQAEALAWSHPHGRWAQWLAADLSGSGSPGSR